MKKAKLSIIIIAKNEEEMIGDCLASARQVADEIILVDSGSTDKTNEIAKKDGAKIIKVSGDRLAFAKWRNVGLKAASGDWLLYVDADERVTPELRKELPEAMGDRQYAAYQIPRRNFYLGKEVHYGGAWPDYVKRLFLRKNLKGWERELHEDPVFSAKGGPASGGEGKIGKLKSPFIHLTHRDLSSMVEKTRQWSKIEAKLLDKAGHPPVTWWRLLRPIVSEFWQRGIKKQGLRDGMVGWIEVIFQMFSRFITYARLWEIQNKK